MDKNKEVLVDIIFKFWPLFGNNIFKGIPYKNHGKYYHLVTLVDKFNGRPMKFYCEKLMISKPNLSKMVNKAIEVGAIERKYDEKDRRVINLFVTEKGKEEIKKSRKLVREAILNNLNKLDEETIARFTKNLKEMIVILEKL
ncbi:MarR family winged helix-turn-helix transcriptional regulator [Clostridiaceae bacterium M8S5]|nr:MarR family winged helix-turn-helix transcriptional regulator [Clostridiaceae bacterium M8S5]